MHERYIALIPAYEPDGRMLETAASLGKEGFEVVIVDDGSSPECSGLFEQAAERLPGKGSQGAEILIHEENRGKGAALKTGLEYIQKFMTERDHERDCIIVTVDADGQHLPGDAAKVARAAAASPGTLVLGSRDLGNSDKRTVPLRSRAGNAITRKVFSMVTGASIYDTQTGLRAFTADLIPWMLTVDGERYEYELNVLMDGVRRGIPVTETGIETVYHEGNASSHFDTVKDSFRIYRDIAKQAAKFSASSFVSFLADYALYALLLMSGAGLAAANILARIASSSLNFTINRRLVFNSNKSLAKSAAGYFTLAAFILAGNTAVLTILTGRLGIGSMAAKVITEIIFFAISWTVQRYVIFYGGPDGKTAHDGNERKERFTAEYTAVRPKKLRSIYRSDARRTV